MGTTAEIMKLIKETASLADYAAEHLESKGQKHVCPNCKSGTKTNGTPAFSIYDNGMRWHCHSCNTDGDIYDLAGIVNGTEDRKEQLLHVAAWAGIGAPIMTASPNAKATVGNHSSKGQREGAARRDSAEAATRSQRQAEEAEYIKQAQQRISDPRALAYLEGRGIDEETARRWGLGYDPSANGAPLESGGWTQRGRIVIPWKGCEWYHLDRVADGGKVSDMKYIKPKGLKQPQLYNPEAMNSASFFVVESAFNALALEDMGRHAVALGGTAYEDKLEQLISAAARGCVPIIALDNDGEQDGTAGSAKGRGNARKLCEAIKAQGLPCVMFDYMDDSEEDIFERSRSNPEALASLCDQAEEAAARALEEHEEELLEDAVKELHVFNPEEVMLRIFEGKAAKRHIPTGFKSLDDVLNGGLTPGQLTILGAGCSVGKTSLFVQLSCNLAASAVPVMFVTIEQSAEELAAKSISRYMAMAGTPYRCTGSDMLNEGRRDGWGLETSVQWTSLQQACYMYAEDTSEYLRILEGEKQPTVKAIRTRAMQMAKKYGRPPVVIIDYLQLLANPDQRTTDKMAVDFNVMELRQMARDLNAAVLCISSMNRASYNESIDLASFKESGSIEYSADVLIGIQPSNVFNIWQDTEKTKEQRQALILKRYKEYKAAAVATAEIMVLKNRSGRVPEEPFRIKFDKEHSHFFEPTEASKAR